MLDGWFCSIKIILAEPYFQLTPTLEE
jgi:hypothetical protein